MAGDTAQLGIVVKAQDQTGRVLSNIEKHVGGIDRGVLRLHKRFGALNAVFQGLGIGVGVGSFYAIERAIGRLIRVIPDLVGRGEEWAAVVDEIGDLTGMTAEQSSEFAVVAKVVEGGVEGMGRALVQLANNAVNNSEAFAKLGIRVRANNGEMLDAYTIFQNVRRAISSNGAALLSTTAARTAFGRGAKDLIDILLLEDAQYRTIADSARNMGIILTEQQVRMAEAFARTKNLMDLAFTGIGSQVFQNALPALTALVNGITQAIQQNMDKIVRFVVQVVNFIAGLIGGLIGINFGLVTAMQQVAGESETLGPGLRDVGAGATAAASGTDAYTRSLNRQIEAISRQLALLDRQDRRVDARREQARILADIADAKAELEEIRGKTIFAATMSEAEAILARQQQAGEILDAQKRVAEAERRMRDFQRRQRMEERRMELEQRRTHLQKLLTEHTQTLARIQQRTLDATRDMGLSFEHAFDPVINEVLPELTTAMQKAADEARESGRQVAKAIMDALFGPEVEMVLSRPGTWRPPGTRQGGGLIDSIANLVRGVSSLLDGMNNLFGASTPLVVGLLALGLLANPLIAIAAALAIFVGKPLWDALEGAMQPPGGAVEDWLQPGQPLPRGPIVRRNFPNSPSDSLTPFLGPGGITSGGSFAGKGLAQWVAQLVLLQRMGIDATTQKLEDLGSGLYTVGTNTSDTAVNTTALTGTLPVTSPPGATFVVDRISGGIGGGLQGGISGGIGGGLSGGVGGGLSGGISGGIGGGLSGGVGGGLSGGISGDLGSLTTIGGGLKVMTTGGQTVNVEGSSGKNVDVASASYSNLEDLWNIRDSTSRTVARLTDGKSAASYLRKLATGSYTGTSGVPGAQGISDSEGGKRGRTVLQATFTFDRGETRRALRGEAVTLTTSLRPQTGS